MAVPRTDPIRQNSRLTGVVIAAPVYWLFTQFLAVNLPGLSASGWL